MLQRLGSTAGTIELLAQPLPAFEVLVIELRTLQSKLCGPAYETSLEHKSQGVAHENGLQFGVAGLFKCLGIRAMTSHAIVQASAAGHESFGFGVVLAVDQSHKFIHEVAMKPWWTKRVFRNHPSRRKNREVNIGGAGNFRRRSQHRVNRRIGVVESYGVNAIKIREIIFIGHIVSVPCHELKRRVID